MNPADHPESDKPLKTVAAVVAATTFAHTASMMGAAIYPVIAPRLAADLGLSPSFVGYQVSLAYGAGMFTTALFSSWILRVGACRMMQASIGLAVLAMLLTLLGNVPAILGATALLGFSMAMMTPASVHVLFRFSPPSRRNLIFSIKQTGVPLAWLLIGLTAPVITVAFGWAWAVAAVAATEVAIILLLEPARRAWDDDRSTDAVAASSFIAGIGLIWRIPVLRSLAIAAFFYCFVQLCVASFLVTMLVEETHRTLVEAGAMLSLLQLAGILFRVASGWFADRSDGFRVLYLINIGMVASCLLSGFVTPQWGTLAIMLLCVAFGATAVGWNGVFLAVVAEQSPEGMVGVATGGVMALTFAGILVGPALFATAYAWLGSYSTTYGCLSIAAALGLVFIVAARRSAA
jgi:MFS family permease